MKIATMEFPPVHPMLALPVAGITFVTAAFSRIAAAANIDGDTGIQITLVIAAMLAIVKFVHWYSTECERDRAVRKAQSDLIRMLIERSRDVSDRDRDVQQLLIKLDAAESNSKNADPKDGKR